MSENVSERLFPGSFRGVPFFVKDTLTTSFGRKIVLNEIPDSDKRIIQDLGLFNRTFELIVTTGCKGSISEDYYQSRDNLIAAMERPDKGILVHPTLGSIEVSPGTGDVRESFSALGDPQFTLNFSISQPDTPPFDTGDHATAVNRSGEVARDLLSGGLGSRFNISQKFKNNITDGINTVTGFADKARFALRQIQLDSSTLAEVTRIINAIDGGAPGLVFDAENLSAAVSGLFEELLNLGLSPQSNVSLFSDFFDFCDEREFSLSQTREVIERNRNKRLFCETVQAHALVQSYRAVSLIDFDNVAALNAIRVGLDNQFSRVILDTILDGDSQDALEKITG